MKNAMKSIDVPAKPHSRRGVLARVRDALADGPTREEARRRLQSKPGFFASLSPEALEYIKNYDGPENLGPPHPKR
jgi:hypothetical protein